MNDDLKRIKPRERPELHPRLFVQVLNPYKPVLFNQDLLAYDREQFYQKSAVPVRSFGRCIGHFFDIASKKGFLIDLGPVWVNCRDSYRAMPSSVEVSAAQAFTVESATDQPFEGEGIALYDSFSTEHRPERSEDGAEVENRPGPYVIPGQSAMGGIKHQFEWSESKCAGELC